MPKISSICTVIGLSSIILSLSGIFFPLDEFVGYNLPFNFLLISLSSASIAVPKFSIFVDTLHKPIFSYFLSTILIISGIGTMSRKPWGRSFAYIYSISMVLISMIGMLVILPGYLIMYDKMSRQSSLSLLPVYAGVIGYFLTSMTAFLYPLFLLIFFSRLKIKEEFTTRKSPVFNK